MDDRLYHEVGRRLPISKRMSIYARQRIYDLFVSTMHPNTNTTIVDIGASGDESEETNFLEKKYPYPARITCCSLDDGREIKATYPQIRHVKIEAGKPLPFDDQTFDIAYSSAVLEHVGGREQRIAFIRDAARVAHSIFFTVPNRWFPIEHHTAIPLLHYAPQIFRSALRGSKFDYWTHPSHLDFLDVGLLRSEWPLTEKMDLLTAGLPFGPFSSNIVIISPRR